MADEAFALSPISARAALPGEEDYAAISEAFMETSRGRWFLTEYAKRNRNADTRMVLDAVARIEHSLTAQREETLAAQREGFAAQQQAADAAAAKSAAAAATAAAEASDNRMKVALGAIRTAVEAAQTSATEALDGLALEQRQAAVRKGARVLREIAWRLREIGNDSRICDLIDSQVAVIEKASEEVTTDEAKAALSAAFAGIGGRLAEFGGNGRAAASAAETTSLDTPDMPPAAMAEPVETIAAPEAAEASAMSFAEPAEAEVAEAAHTETALAETEAALAPAETLEVTDVIDTAVTDEAADADDEAILDLIAMEMGAPDPIDDDEIAAAMAEPAHFAEPAPVEQAIVAEVPEPIAAPMEMPPQPAVEAVAAPAVEMSLGSSILASGMLSKPTRAANDPLAPIRRMSQVEKIAFFS
ncbi:MULTISPECIES: hypothetical protein [Bradyrhizobium]|uniref:Chemotaxis protein n=2 Tax=Bradyrhizobium TaxID=374 RepID=A0ABY0Q9N2_9BRAD|nr:MULTISPECIES: hypothetical protein [Bradyrhizobium]SDJ74433.1 hypothetical protein SAMN05444163_6325 [Bradyrhizobium ottawaense]SEC18322.1 hypothetical protein SAMN05444171_0834 [Bradyrhizobium lablabi]